mgnify:FL=1|tara:strand:- start:183 stop:425 length:243 start_codon:yes stop_codon:yes gene_type:complete
MTYEITHEQRLVLLEAHNELRTALQTLEECQDLWLSDVRNLDKLQYSLHRIFKFVPPEDEEGRRMHYGDWILDEEDGDDV